MVTSSSTPLSIAFLAFITFFSTVSPINCVIVYLRLTSGLNKEERKYVRNRSVLIGAIVTIVFTLIGPSGFKLLGIELYSVKIAGGIVLAVVAVKMVFGNNVKPITTDRNTEDYTKLAVVPLALPIISSPPTIVTSIILFAEYDFFYLKILVLLMLLLNFGIVYWLFCMSSWFHRIIKKSVLNVLFILTGIILTALSVQFLLNGVKDSGILKNLQYNNLTDK